MDASPLKKLPAEVRNDISALVLQRSEPIKLSIRNFPTREANGKMAQFSKLRESKQYNGRDTYDPPNPLPITATCKQLRNETIGMFYSINTFEFVTTRQAWPSHGDWSQKLVYKLFRHIIGEPNFEAIANVKIEVELEDLGQDNGRCVKQLKQVLVTAQKIATSDRKVIMSCWGPIGRTNVDPSVLDFDREKVISWLEDSWTTYKSHSSFDREYLRRICARARGQMEMEDGETLRRTLAVRVQTDDEDVEV